MRAQGFGPLERFYFAGDEEMNTTVGNTAFSDQSNTSFGAVARATSSDHGYKAGSPIIEKPTCILMQNVTGYLNRLYTIKAVAANTIDLMVGRYGNYTAVTPAGTELLYPGLTFDSPYWFCGYLLHLSAACATSEDFTIDVDSNWGSYWDYNVATIPMNGVQDYGRIWAEHEWIPLDKRDILKCSYANTDDRTWGLILFARKIA